MNIQNSEQRLTISYGLITVGYVSKANKKIFRKTNIIHTVREVFLGYTVTNEFEYNFSKNIAPVVITLKLLNIITCVRYSRCAENCGNIIFDYLQWPMAKYRFSFDKNSKTLILKLRRPNRTVEPGPQIKIVRSSRGLN